MGRRSENGDSEPEKREWEGNVIKMPYVFVSVPQDKFNNHVSQEYTKKLNISGNLKGQINLCELHLQVFYTQVKFNSL